MNYKAFNTEFEQEKFSMKEWIWDHYPYWFRKFIRKFRRWWRYTTHLWKENCWNEYPELIRIIQLQLEIMAKEFEEYGITMSSEQDASRMRLVSKLLQRFCEEYYFSKHSDEAYDDAKIDKAWEEMANGTGFGDDIYKDGYNHEHIIKGALKDQKCLELACKLLAREIPGWWQ